MRSARIQRNTRETSITLALTLDDLGKAEVSTGVGFLDHMLELFARHGDFDLTVRCEGDTQVDFHHSVEDIGICLSSLHPGPGRQAGHHPLRSVPAAHGRDAGSVRL